MASTINAVTSGGGGIAVGGDTSGVIGLQSNGTTFATGNQYGIGLGTAVPSSGIGIAFPATQSASSDANTLDDYEEGTWLPILTPNSGTITMDGTLKYGAYTKVGRLVTVTGNVGLTASGASGSIFFSGLPFAVDTSITANGERFAGGVFLNGWGSGNGYGAVLVDTGTSGSLQTSTAAVPVADASQEIYIGFSYFTT